MTKYGWKAFISFAVLGSELGDCGFCKLLEGFSVLEWFQSITACLSELLVEHRLHISKAKTFTVLLKVYKLFKAILQPLFSQLQRILALVHSVTLYNTFWPYQCSPFSLFPRRAPGGHRCDSYIFKIPLSVRIENIVAIIKTSRQWLVFDPLDRIGRGGTSIWERGQEWKWHTALRPGLDVSP